MDDIYTLDKLDPIEAEAIRGSAAQKGIYVTPGLIRRFNGDGNTAIIFKRFLYCCEQWADEEGWFFQTAETIEQVVGLGYTALQRSVKRLEKMNLIEKRRAGMPYKTYYRVNLSAYLELIKQASSGTSAKTRLDTSAETSPDTSGETCPDTSSEQVILSDTVSNDTKNDTNPANAVFPETPSPAPSKLTTFQPGDDYLDVISKCAAKREQAGGNYAVPARAGGDDGLADLALQKLYEFSGSEAPAEGKERDRQRDKVAEVLKAYGCADAPPKVVEEAACLHCAAKGEFVNVYYTSFPADFGKYLGQARASHKKKDDYRVRVTEANEEAQAALEAKPKPPLRERTIWDNVLDALATQVGRNEFRTYLADTWLIGQENGTLRVAVGSAFDKDWIENRLGLTIKRALAGLANAPGGIVFEVES